MRKLVTVLCKLDLWGCMAKKRSQGEKEQEATPQAASPTPSLPPTESTIVSSRQCVKM